MVWAARRLLDLAGHQTIALLTATFLLLWGGGWRRALVLAPLMLLYPALADHFAYAQCQLLLLLIFVLMIRLINRGCDIGAGLLLALASYSAAGVPGRHRWLLHTQAATNGVRLGGSRGDRGHGDYWVAVGPRCLDFLQGARFATGYEFLALPLNVSVSAVVSRIF